MKKSLFTLLLLISISVFSLKAQVVNHDAQYRAQVFLQHIERIGANNLDYLEEEYIGSPYSNPIFLLGKIYEDNKIIASNYALRYNAMFDEIEVKETLYEEDSNMKVLSKSPELYVKIMNDMFVYVPSSTTNKNAGYFQVLHVGDNCNLYKKVYKKHYPAKKAQNSFEKDVIAKYVDRSTYYLVMQDGEFKEFSSSKNKILRTFGDKQDDVKKYVKKGKLDVNEETDLMKVVKYYDSLEADMK